MYRYGIDFCCCSSLILFSLANASKENYVSIIFIIPKHSNGCKVNPKTSNQILLSTYLQEPKGSHEFPQLPLLRGKRFDLLGPGSLADTLAHCLYCGRKIINTSSRLRHINTEHGAEHQG